MYIDRSEMSGFPWFKFKQKATWHLTNNFSVKQNCCVRWVLPPHIIFFILLFHLPRPMGRRIIDCGSNFFKGSSKVATEKSCGVVW